MWNAIDDAALTARGPSPYGLRARFLDWVDELEEQRRHTMDVPKMFALTREADDPFDAVVGYGFVLPDGATYAVAWPTTSGSAFYSTSTPQQCADLRGADLRWIGDQP